MNNHQSIKSMESVVVFVRIVIITLKKDFCDVHAVTLVSVILLAQIRINKIL